LFRETYSQHRMRTEGNRSPLQLWISGMATMNDTDVVNTSDYDCRYGINCDALCHCNVMMIMRHLFNRYLALLLMSNWYYKDIDVLEVRDHFGVGLYI
uniref:Uncharacterized protein n=1 Tax=Amphimedon queenslandica TaxID=400682 RepID=A0A1X7UQ71_AMPQE